jgi:DNA-binding protein
MAQTFEQLVTAYIDSMPPRSKVNFPDLVSVVMQRFTAETETQNAHLGTSHVPAGSYTSRNEAYVLAVARKVVYDRKDITVERGRGICKHAVDVKEVK